MFDSTLDEKGSESTLESDAYVACLETVALIERLQRLRLEVIRDELRRIGLADVTPAQALLLFRIGDRVLTPCEISRRHFEECSNLSYTLSRLAERGFLRRRRNQVDGRSVVLALTERGKAVRDAVVELFQRHGDELSSGAFPAGEGLERLRRSLQVLECHWTRPSLRPR